MKINSIKTYVVETKERPYKIYFGNDIVSKANIILDKYIKNKSIVIIYDKALIKQVVSGQTPPMPSFEMEPQSMADLLAHLHSLN